MKSVKAPSIIGYLCSTFSEITMIIIRYLVIASVSEAIVYYWITTGAVLPRNDQEGKAC